MRSFLGREVVDLPRDLFLIVFNTSNSLAQHGLVPTLVGVRGKGHFPRRFTVVNYTHATCASRACHTCLGRRLVGFNFLAGRRVRALSSFLSAIRCRSVSPTSRAACFLLGSHLGRLSPRCRGGKGCLFCLTAPPLLCRLVPGYLRSTNLLGGPKLGHVVIRGPFKCSLTSTRGLGGVCTTCFGRRSVCHVSRFLNGRAIRGVVIAHFKDAVCRPV